eukprot:TRINITY_DN4526_c0_g1_i2.p1 TRINITY_DN4526_c0_g1~~TRINITY_DN4526_c0_g1_i2.p1  ORF type:complete len:315 (+),score=77.17 TRINITY_DN4526_c0_g1_i2:218-1162(+)
MGTKASKQAFAFESTESKAPEFSAGIHGSDEPVDTSARAVPEEIKQQKVLAKIEALDSQYANKLFGNNPSNVSRTFANASELQKHLAAKPTDRDFREKPSSADVPIKIVIIGEPNFFMRVAAQLQGYEYNAMHVALQIGEKLVDWCDHSLAYPRPLKATTAFAVIELGVLNQYDDKAKFDRLCEMIEYWNVNEKYDQKTKNCQHFVDEALRILELQLPKTGPIVEFLNAIRKGKLDKAIPSLSTFDPSAPKTFKTHLEVDQYFIKLLQQRYPNTGLNEASIQFKAEHPDVYNLLKGFDRAFWICLLYTSPSPRD